MKQILVPTDGSTYALKALDVALDLAGAHGATLHLLHVLMRDKEPVDLLRLADLALGAHPDIVATLKDLADRPAQELSAEQLMADPARPLHPVPASLLQDIGTVILEHADAAATKRGIAAQMMPVGEGDIAGVIAAAAHECQADAIVMGMRGLRQVDMVTLGSISQQVCHQAPCTCITVH